MSEEIKEILNKLRKCDDFHDRCDCLLGHDEITYLLDYIQQKENIIKEVREYIKYNATSNYFDREKNMFRREIDLLEILDKVDKGE